jgi:hypothetical protein
MSSAGDRTTGWEGILGPVHSSRTVQMRIPHKRLFHFMMFLYAGYNCFWIVGTMFSFGKNDTRRELIYFVLTFVLDIPVLWWTKKRLRLGSFCLLLILVSSLWLAESLRILNLFTVLFWYSPKLVPWLTAVWPRRARASEDIKLTNSCGENNRPSQRDLSDIAGTWRHDPEFESAIAAQDSVDEDLWR